MRFAVAIVSPPDDHDISGGALNEVAEASHYALLALGHDSVLANRLDFDGRATFALGDNLLIQHWCGPKTLAPRTLSNEIGRRRLLIILSLLSPVSP